MDHAPPILTLLRTRAAATTYEFVVRRPLGGWAICTINDMTGELLITSDWGNWAHQWPAAPQYLGAPSLTAFLAGHRDVDYVARKLQGRRGGEEFDCAASTKAFVRLIALRRLEHGREAIEYARERRLDAMDYGPAEDRNYTRERAEIHLDRQSRRYLTARSARNAVEAIKDVGDDIGTSIGEAAVTLYIERLLAVFELHDLRDFCNEPWEELVYRQSTPDRILRETILPALFAACADTAYARALIAANGPQPAPEYPAPDTEAA